MRKAILTALSIIESFGVSVKAWSDPLPSLPCTTSTSRQFIVYSTDAAVRGALCNSGERTKATLLRLTDQPDKWKTPIIVSAQYSQANLSDAAPVALYFSQTGLGLKIQLDLMIERQVTEPALERELLRAIVLELMYREKPKLPPGTAYVQPPDWLLDGILASASDYKPSALFEILRAAVAENKVLPLQQFLDQRAKPLDSPSRQLFSAYSLALVMLLTDSPENRQRFARYITELPNRSTDVGADLRSHFATLGSSAETAEKAWIFHIARLSSLGSYQSLSLAETERQLNELLEPNFSGLSLRRLDDHRRFIRVASSFAAFHQLSVDLMLLAADSHPMYRQIIFQYQEIVSTFMRNKTARIAGRLDQLRRERKAILTRMEKMEDYLNWFEATQSRTNSGAFADYLKVAAKPNDSTFRRRDAISVYLDVLEGEFQ